MCFHFHISCNNSNSLNIIGKMKSLLAFVLVLGLVASIAINHADAYCCNVDGHRGWPPHCNIFGCNCDCAKCDGLYDKSCCAAEIAGIECPKQRMRRALAPVQVANRTFSRIDLSGDGAISVEEALKFLVYEKGMGVEQLSMDKSWFAELDKNGDGKLQPKELDSALKH